MKSIAPSSRARKTWSRSAWLEITITGVGRFAISKRRKAKPSISGISRSRVIASGRRSKAICRASLPFTARPTTSIAGSPASIDAIVWRL